MLLGSVTTSSSEPPDIDHPIVEYLRDCRAAVLASLEQIVPRSRRYREVLYDLILEYPLRDAKTMRPALCVAACRALGGKLEAVLPSACVLELYHNAFLIHDDVEDDSERRRNGMTLHRAHGVPIAINVGDAMLSLCLEPLLDNTRLVGLGPALRVLEVIATMARLSAEGQALELAWIKQERWDLSATDYLRMVRKKTSHYTFVAPTQIGAIIGGADAEIQALLRSYAFALGTAFQIRDDVLNLTRSDGEYGKDYLADLREGKRTLITLHALRCASDAERAHATRVFARMQLARSRGSIARLGEELARLERAGEISKLARASLEARFVAFSVDANQDISCLLDLIERYDSIGYARALGERSILHAVRTFGRLAPRLQPSVHLDFLRELTVFVSRRDH